MQHITQRRNELDLSQAELVLSCGSSRQCLSDIENGHHLPTPEMATALRVKLKHEGIPDSSQILSQRRISGLVKLRPFDLPPVDQEPWQRMHRAYPRQVGALRLSTATLSWLCSNLPSETAVEGLRLCSVAARGAQGVFANPHHLGYRDSCLLDQHGRALGERLLPALHWQEPDFEVILWPQPRLLGSYGTFRPDGLLFLKVGRGRYWRGEEMDGPVHEREERRAWDKERERLVGLNFLRFSSQQVLRLEYPDLLATAIRALRPAA